YSVFSTAGKANESALINRLYNSALGRDATSSEINKLKKFMGRDKAAFFQDLYWALLNSNEFIVNH
ncbi:MAG: hypothetical protein ACK5Q5_16965, partial [Planctomycetaceae bacterium]